MPIMTNKTISIKEKGEPAKRDTKIHGQQQGVDFTTTIFATNFSSQDAELTLVSYTAEGQQQPRPLQHGRDSEQVRKHPANAAYMAQVSTIIVID